MTLDEVKPEIASIIEEGEAFEDRQEFDLALARFREANELAILQRLKFEQALSLANMGRILFLQSENIASRECMLQALHFFEELAETDEKYTYFIFRASMNLGVVLARMGLFSDALTNYLKALTYALKNDDEEVLSLIYLNTAPVYRRLHHDDEALFYNQKAIELLKKTGDKYAEATCYINIGNIYTDKKKYRTALKYLFKALKILEKLNHRKGLLMAFNNISDAYCNLKQLELAEEYTQKLLALAKEANDIYHNATGLSTLGRIFNERKQYKKAENYLKRAERLCKKLNDPSTLQDTYRAIIIMYCKSGNYERAYDYQLKLIKLLEITFNERNVSKIAALETELKIKEQKHETEIYQLKNVELEQANKEIANKNLELEEMNEYLKELHHSKDSIMGIVSHDLKNLIGTVLNSCEVMRHHSVPEKLDKYVGIIEQATQKALNIVRDILEINAIDTKDFNLELVETDLNAYLATQEEQFALSCFAKNIRFLTSFCPEKVKVLLQPEKFWQILNNLIHNAIKFTTVGGTITLTTEYMENWIHIKVSDTGIGIPKELLPIIFNKYTKATRKGTEGEQTTGLGLSIVRRLVELHNGEVGVSSVVGKGSVFTIKLPIIK